MNVICPVCKRLIFEGGIKVNKGNEGDFRIMVINHPPASVTEIDVSKENWHDQFVFTKHENCKGAFENTKM